jgi:hypothetical protein
MLQLPAPNGCRKSYHEFAASMGVIYGYPYIIDDRAACSIIDDIADSEVAEEEEDEPLDLFH